MPRGHWKVSIQPGSHLLILTYHGPGHRRRGWQGIWKSDDRKKQAFAGCKGWHDRHGSRIWERGRSSRSWDTCWFWGATPRERGALGVSRFIFPNPYLCKKILRVWKGKGFLLVSRHDVGMSATPRSWLKAEWRGGRISEEWDRIDDNEGG